MIVRTNSAGVFAGYLESKKGKEVRLVKAIRLWYWKGAASLSQLAIEGVKYPEQCKFGVPVTVTLTEAIEILETTEIAKACIERVTPWRQ